MKTDKENYVLFLTVGGSPEPLIESLKYFKPEYAVFICSRDSLTHLNEIMQKSGENPIFQSIVISDHQDLLSCVREIREEIPEILEKFRLPPSILLIADITGGTKVMSVALGLVMMEYKSRFSYVGGKQQIEINEDMPVRAKDGQGQVLDGQEQVYETDNPLEKLGISAAQTLVRAFNNAQYETALAMCSHLKNINNDFRSFYDGFYYIVKAYNSWDLYNYKDAQKDFKTGYIKIRTYNNRKHRDFQSLFSHLTKDSNQLEVLANDMAKLQDKFEALDEGEGEAYMLDLLANAVRRGENGLYDDAVARLYSLVEKTAKIALARKGINNSDVTREQLEMMGEDFIAKYSDKEDGKIQLPLTASFMALGALDGENRIYKSYMANADKLANALQARNKSLLAHGYNPVKKEVYDKLLNIILDFLEIRADNLPRFPRLEVAQILP